MFGSISSKRYSELVGMEDFTCNNIRQNIRLNEKILRYIALFILLTAIKSNNRYQQAHISFPKHLHF